MNKIRNIVRNVLAILAIVIAVPVVIVVGLAALALVITTWYAFAGIVMLALIVALLRHAWVEGRKTPSDL